MLEDEPNDIYNERDEDIEEDIFDLDDETFEENICIYNIKR